MKAIIVSVSSLTCWGGGLYSYVGDNVVFMGKIGRFTSISSRVHVINGRHPIKSPYVSSSPVFYAKSTPVGSSFVEAQIYEEYTYVDKNNKYPVVVGNDCWIGFGASIVEGVTVGDGAVVLANATVTKDVSPYAIVGGVPAKVVGYRYDNATIEKLLASKWWEKDELWLKQKAHLFDDIENFLDE